MKKLTTLFLTLALLAGISAVFGANAADAVKKLPKPDSMKLSSWTRNTESVIIWSN
ncbi:MAG: hypothetical protein V8T87_00440 [Victivallales bacterium]